MLGNVRAQLATEEAEGSSPKDGKSDGPKDGGKPDEAKKGGDSGKPKDDGKPVEAKKGGDSGKHNDDKSKKPKDKKDDKSLIQVAKSSMLGNVRAQLATEEAEGSSPKDGKSDGPKDGGKPDEAKK